MELGSIQLHWGQALESGNCALHTISNEFCCLDVAASLVAPGTPRLKPGQISYSYDGSAATISGKIQNLLGLSDKGISALQK